MNNLKVKADTAKVSSTESSKKLTSLMNVIQNLKNLELESESHVNDVANIEKTNKMSIGSLIERNENLPLSTTVTNNKQYLTNSYSYSKNLDTFDPQSYEIQQEKQEKMSISLLRDKTNKDESRIKTVNETEQLGQLSKERDRDNNREDFRECHKEEIEKYSSDNSEIYQNNKDNEKFENNENEENENDNNFQDSYEGDNEAMNEQQKNHQPKSFFDDGARKATYQASQGYQGNNQFYQVNTSNFGIGTMENYPHEKSREYDDFFRESNSFIERERDLQSFGNKMPTFEKQTSKSKHSSVSNSPNHTPSSPEFKVSYDKKEKFSNTYSFGNLNNTVSGSKGSQSNKAGHIVRHSSPPKIDKSKESKNYKLKVTSLYEVLKFIKDEINSISGDINILSDAYVKDMFYPDFSLSTEIEFKNKYEIYVDSLWKTKTRFQEVLNSFDQIMARKENVNNDFMLKSVKVTSDFTGRLNAFKKETSYAEQLNFNATIQIPPNSKSMMAIEDLNSFTNTQPNLERSKSNIDALVEKYQKIVNDYKSKLYSKVDELNKAKKLNEEYENIVSTSKSLIEELYAKNNLLKEKLRKYKIKE